MNRDRELIRDEMIRQAVAFAPMLALVILMHPRVQLWMRHQAWRLTQATGRDRAAEDAAVAELRRDISAWEHQA